MLLCITLFVVGFFLTVTGLVHIICYLNLLTVGYNLLSYVNYIIRQKECLYAPIGIVIMLLAVYLPKGAKK